SRRRHTRFSRDWSSDVCSSDLRPNISAPFQTPWRALPRVPFPPSRSPPVVDRLLRLSGLEPFVLTTDIPFVNVGERTNVTGSARSEERRVGKEWRVRGGPLEPT